MLKAGIAVVDVTPPAGVRLYGFAGRTKDSFAAHDPMSARAVAFDDGEKRFCIVGLDAGGLNAPLVERIHKRIRRRARIAPSHVALICSHSHSAPRLWLPGKPPGAKDIELEYTQAFVSSVADAVASAIEDLRPARVGAKSGWCAIGCNRRELDHSGNIILGHAPYRPVDTELGVIRIDDAKGRTRCLLTNYGCHGIALVSDNLLASADWMGFARYHIEKAMRGKVTAVFAQGCAGNVNTRTPETVTEGLKWKAASFGMANNLGAIFAREAVRVAGEIKTSGAGDIQVRSTTVKLPRDKKAQVAWKKERLRRMKAAGRPKGDHDSCYTLWDPRPSYGPARLKKEIARVARDRSASIPAQVQAFSVGDVAFLTWPGEVFAQLGMAAKERSPFRKTYVCGYANAGIGYIPIAAAWPEGGYEAGCALDRGLARGVGEVLVDKSAKLLESIWKKRR